MAFVRVPSGKRTNGKRSALEDRVSKLLPADAVYEGERLPYTVSRKYTPDFCLPNGIRLEVKGWFTSADRTKMLAVKKAHPTLDIRMVFSRPSSKLNKGSKSTYADWCDKHGFPWCIASNIPKNWILNPNEQ